MLFSLNVEKSKKSLIVRNEIIEKLYNELGVNFGYSFNDLYKVKSGVVRRLKGGISNKELYERRELNNMKEYNKLFDKVKEYLENLEFEGFKIEFNKRLDYGWRDYRYMKERGFEGNFLDYKNFVIENEGTCILKIKWDV
jgi:hypothetical protein